MPASTTPAAFLDFFDAADPAAKFLAAFRATTMQTTLGEYRTLHRVCRMLVEQRVRMMIENYAATEQTAFTQLMGTDLGLSLSEADELIEHSIFVLEAEEKHAAFVAECKACGF
jgi:hypothetical protein